MRSPPLSGDACRAPLSALPSGIPAAAGRMPSSTGQEATGVSYEIWEHEADCCFAAGGADELGLGECWLAPTVARVELYLRRRWRAGSGGGAVEPWSRRDWACIRPAPLGLPSNCPWAVLGWAARNMDHDASTAAECGPIWRGPCTTPQPDISKDFRNKYILSF